MNAIENATGNWVGNLSSSVKTPFDLLSWANGVSQQWLGMSAVLGVFMIILITLMARGYKGEAFIAASFAATMIALPLVLIQAVDMMVLVVCIIATGLSAVLMR